MRTQVSFRFPAEFIGSEEDEGILGVNGAVWFADRLRQVSGLSVAPRFIQEDWGVAIPAERARQRLWIGLGVFGDGVWIAHLHLSPFARLLSFLPSRRGELLALSRDLHSVLASDSAVSEIRWYDERDMKRPPYKWSPTPESA
jgi:hypothetical protein